ncbi:hypothetical protein C8Q74DRAFT_1370227 [Fomes fomentarius]|nr:hypothetical protein C8Q74DRAFT_1370227 [Fomes fomentarius]
MEPYHSNHFEAITNEFEKTPTYYGVAPAMRYFDTYRYPGNLGLTNNLQAPPTLESLAMPDPDVAFGPVLSQSTYGNATSQTPLSQPVLYDGLSLCDLLRANTFTTLQEPNLNGPAFPAEVALPQKMSVRILVEGHDKYDRQVNILCAKARPLTRAKLAVVIAKEVHRLLNRETRNSRPLQYCDRELTLDDLILYNVRHVSRGSIQPTIGVLPMRG